MSPFCKITRNEYVGIFHSVTFLQFIFCYISCNTFTPIQFIKKELMTFQDVLQLRITYFQEGSFITQSSLVIKLRWSKEIFYFVINLTFLRESSLCILRTLCPSGLLGLFFSSFSNTSSLLVQILCVPPLALVTVGKPFPWTFVQIHAGTPW